MSNTESTLSLVFLVFVYLGAQWPRNQMGRLSPSHKEDIGAAAEWAWCRTTLCILCSLRHSQGLRLHPSHVQHPLTCGRNKAEMKQSTFDTLLHNSSKYQQKSKKSKEAAVFFKNWFSRCKKTCLFGKEPNKMSHQCDFSSARVKICDTKTIILSDCVSCRHCVGCQNNRNGIYFTFSHRAALWHINTTQKCVKDFCWVEGMGHMNELLV